MLDLAVRDGRLGRNPAAGVRLPRVRPAGAGVPVGRAGGAALADAAGRYRLLVLALASRSPGLRFGEATALRVPPRRPGAQATDGGGERV